MVSVAPRANGSDFFRAGGVRSGAGPRQTVQDTARGRFPLRRQVRGGGEWRAQIRARK